MQSTHLIKYGPLMLDLAAKDLMPEEKEMLQHPLIGGIILFARNYESPEQLKKLVAGIRCVRPGLLIGVDQEGGRVQRFCEGFTKLPPLAEFGILYKQDKAKAIHAANASAKQMASEIMAMGIDFSFAPVLDIEEGISTVIGDRSFAQDPEAVCQLAAAYISGLRSMGMAAVGKHFPGHGAVGADSHKELPIDQREVGKIFSHDLLPYLHLKNQLSAIMTAHIIYSAADANPASFSSFWLREILRKQLQFDGAILSDDLGMHGASFAGDFLSRTQMALEAGCDMALICNNREGAISVLDYLSYDFSDDSQRRIQALQKRE